MILHKAYQKDVEILTDVHPNYAANGSKTLTDGITGEPNYFFNWLGFEATDFEAVVNLDKTVEINSIRTNFLQEVKSWIWLPKSVEYSISEDGENFKKVGEVKRKSDEKQIGIFTESFVLPLNGLKTKYVKIKTNSLINCPVWHIGHNHGNGKAFLFVDEIIIQ
jgi:hypothetical protein